MNEKHLEVNNLIKSLESEGKIDNLLAHTLFRQSNISHHKYLRDVEIDLKNETSYSSLDMNELLKQLNNPTFANLTKEDLTNLFQEIHNRFIKSNNTEVTRNVYVGETIDYEGAYAYMSHEHDLLFVNKGKIDEYKCLNNFDGNLNKNSIGKFMFDTILHESKHVMQSEDGLNFFLGKEMDEDRAFSGVWAIITSANFNVASRNGNMQYFDNYHDDYEFHFDEHEASFTAFETLNNALSENQKDFSYYQYLLESTFMTLGFIPCMTMENCKPQIHKKISAIEQFMIEQIDYFNSSIEDCEFKQKIMNLINDYLKLDENGNSKLTTRLNKELTILCENYIKAEKVINEENHLMF